MVLGVVALVVAAGAQSSGGPPLSVRPMMSQHDISVLMGRCVVRNSPGAARAFVRASDKVALEKARRRIHPTLQTCLSGAGSATLNVQSVRGGIAEALLVEDAGLLETALAQPAVAPVRVSAGPEDAAIPAVMSCTVAAAPGAAAALLRAPAESPEEARAFRDMTPSLQACVPASKTVRIKPFHVRGLTAVAVYQRAAAAAGASEMTS